MISTLKALPDNIPGLQLCKLVDISPPTIMAFYKLPSLHKDEYIEVSFEEYAHADEAERRLFEVTNRPQGHTSEEKAGDTKIYRWSGGNIASRVGRCVVTVDPQMDDGNSPTPPRLEDIFKYCVRRLKDLYGIKP